MKTATVAPTFTHKLSPEEVQGLSLKDLTAYRKWLTKQDDPIKDLLKQKQKDEEVKENEEVEALIKEFSEIPNLLFKVEYGEDNSEMLPFADAVKGVKRKIMAKAKGSDEKVERDHNASLSKAQIVSIQKAIKRIVDLAQGNPMRERKEKDETVTTGDLT